MQFSIQRQLCLCLPSTNMLLLLLNVYCIEMHFNIVLASSEIVLIMDYPIINSKLCHKSDIENSAFSNYAFCGGLLKGKKKKGGGFIAFFILFIHFFSLNYTFNSQSKSTWEINPRRNQTAECEFLYPDYHNEYTFNAHVSRVQGLEEKQNNFF